MMGLPVLLLHGWGGSFASSFAAHGWAEQLQAAGRQWIGPDLPGHGLTSASHDPADYADLVVSVLAKLPAGRFDMIGYSLGAKITLGIAACAPERVGRLILIGVGDNGFAPEAAAGAVVDALRHGMHDETPDVVRALVTYSRIGGRDPLALAAVLERPANPLLDPVRPLRASLDVGLDIGLINGDADVIAMPDARLRAYIGPHAYARLPQCGHFELLSNLVVRDLALSALSSTVPIAFGTAST